LSDVSLVAVSKQYREGARLRPVLQDVTATLPGGRLSVLLGRSGSGKSTLLNLVSGIDHPDAGQILVGGQALDALSERARTLFRRRRIGFVFQFFNLVPTLTVEENLLLPLELNGVGRSRGRTLAADYLARVGLGDRGGSFPEQLSGGEQQRVAVARALVHGPELILADEPTGNLDDATGHEVLALLAGLVREEGRTLVMVTHSTEAAGYADAVLELRAGRLAPRAAGDAP
jgi:putative ABC transport system ATP-binding protein